MTLSNIYLLCATVSLIELILLITSQENRLQDIYMAMIVAMIAITNFGYFFLALSKTLEAALLANRIAYIGGVWIPLCALMTVVKLCGLRIPPLAVRLLGVFNFAVFALAMTAGYSEIYYAQASLEFVGGRAVLKTTYGPAHQLFYVMLFVETALAILAVLYTCLIKKKSIPMRIVMLSLLAVVLPRAVYIVRKMFHFQMDVMPIAYTITGTLFVLAYNSMNLYDIALLIAKSHGKDSEHGYIAFDAKKRLLSFNKAAAEFFPVLSRSPIGQAVSEMTLLHREIVTRLDSMASQPQDKKAAPEVRHQELEMSADLFLKINIFALWSTRSLAFRGKKYYLVELVDNTTEHNYLVMQETFNSLLHGTVNHQLEHIQAVHDSVVRSMSFIIANRDGSTGRHVRHTSRSTKLFLDALAASPYYNLPKSFCDKIAKAAPLHDIGKIGVDDVILKKPGKFSEAEYDMMKRHPEIGAEIIEQVFAETEDEEFKEIARNVAHYHHERWDGTGYPDGLKGEEIPLEARIMALLDVFDALVSERVYKKSMSYDDAFTKIAEDINTHFDPVLSEVFLSIKPEIIELYEKLATEEYYAPR